MRRVTPLGGERTMRPVEPKLPGFTYAALNTEHFLSEAMPQKCAILSGFGFSVPPTRTGVLT